MRLIARTQPQGRRLLVIATSSYHHMLADLCLPSFDAELRVAPIRDLIAFDRVLEAVELFRSTSDRTHAVDMFRETHSHRGTPLTIGIKHLLSVIEMARQDHEAVAERLSSLM